MLERSSRSATLLGLGAIALWSMLALLTARTEGIPPFQLTAITFGIGGLAGLAIVAARGRLSLLKQPAAAWALGLFGLFVYHGLYFTAMKLAPPAEVSLFAYLWPLLVVLLSAMLPGQGLRWTHVLGGLLGFAGVAALAFGKGGIAIEGRYALGYGLALVTAFVWAIYSVLSRRMAAVPTDAVAGFCLATAVLAGLTHLATETGVTPGAAQWAAMLGLGLGPVGAAFFLWDIGMKRGDIRFLGVASYATPVLSTLLMVLAGEAAPTLSLLGACGLIALGAVIARK